MKKKIFITIGAILIFLILGIWIYLFMYGTPTNSAEVFARFGIGNGAEIPSPITNTTNTGGNDSDASTTAPKALRQLTLKPIAGATFTGTGILYAEQGTGHIYHLNFGSGAETLVSGTTIPKARTAVFSPGGTHVALTTTYGSLPETIVGSVTLENGTGSLDGVSLPLDAQNIYFGKSTSTLMYTLSDTDGTSGYSYNMNTKKGTQIFRIPLRDVRVLWGTKIYVYTTPTVTQDGALYLVDKNDLVYVTEGESGLMGLTHNGEVIVTISEDVGVISYLVGTGGTRTGLPLPLIPEKCVSTISTFFCASSNITSSNAFPDAWYKGTISLSDSLWSVDIQNGNGSLLSDFLTESGREIDVRTIGANEDGTYLYFINKNDNTLWMFDTTL